MPVLSVLTPCLALILAVCITYWPSRHGDCVIDDLESVGTWQGHFWDRDQHGQPIHTLSYGICFRYLRWLVGRVPNPQYGALNEPQQPRYLNDPRKHHRLSLIVASGAMVSLYCFLTVVLGERLAFFACLLFAVHPTGNQSIAWISGVGYCVALLFATLAGNWVALGVSAVWAYAVFALLYAIAVEAMFATAPFAVLFAILGWWPQAIVAGIIALLICARTFSGALKLRTEQFKAQLMDASLKITLRKLLVVPVKTLAYNVALIVWPKRLGQFHTFGYHYETDQIEGEDRVFWGGVACVVVMVAVLLWAPFPVRFGVIWTVTLLFFFLNWITANQFVAERYAWMPTIGMAILAAYGTAGTPWYWIAVGMLLMRTWAQLPAYQDEMQFYLMNVQNFPNSEVAYGNLGAAYARRGMNGAAMDFWFHGTRLNEQYDVNHYNIFASMRAQAARERNLDMLTAARPFLVKALTCKICHFPTQWAKELKTVDDTIRQNLGQLVCQLPAPVTQPPPAAVPT